LQTLKQYFFFLILGLLSCGGSLRAQDLPAINEVDIPAETEQDSVTLNPKDIIDERNEILADSVKTDTIKAAPEFLTDVVDYYGEDYVYIDRKENKIYLYNKAWIDYGDMKINAGLIILDYNNNEVIAKGIDSAGVYSQKPVFVQANNRVEPDSIRFNFDSEKALVYNSRTEQGGFKVIAEVTKKVNDSVVFLQNVKFTTSDNIDNPEYYFFTRKAKFVPKKKIVTGLTNMYIADVPTPIGLPFAYFPLTEDRSSGFILPTIGENNNRGFFFQNGGYYFVINDYVDLTVQGDYYTNGSYALRSESIYSVRYKYNGRINIRFENLINSERGFPDFSEQSVYNIGWSHSQDAKANPSSRFSASVNLGSSRYFQQSINQVNDASALVNTLRSSISYNKTFDGEPQVNITAALTHSQNTQTEQINMSLPIINASVSRIFPFAPKVGAKKGIIDNVNLQYNLAAENRIATTDSLFFKKEMFDSALYGARHSIPISTNFKVLNYLSASIGGNYNEAWVFKTFDQRYDETANNGAGGVVRDTINGFQSYRTYSVGTSLGTTIYGTFNFGNDKKIQKIRHVMRPSISYGINPGFDQYYDEYTIPNADDAIEDEVVTFSKFSGSLYGAPNELFSSSIGFDISNTFEAKVRDRDTTATEAKTVTFLSNLQFRSSYNLAADSLKLSPVRVSGSIPVVDRLDLNFGGTLDPYALNNNNRKIDEWNVDNGGSLFRLSDANVSMNYSFSSKDFEGDRQDEDKITNETFQNGGRPDDLFGDVQTFRNDGAYATEERKDKGDPQKEQRYNFDIPWTLRLAYTMSYSNAARQNEISSQSLSFSTNLELSPRWTAGVSSGYDFKQKGITRTQFRFERDLESWRMSFNYTPTGAFGTTWFFFVGIKSSILSDIKYDKRRERDRNL